MKIVVVGANHAGTSFLRTLKTLNPKAKISAYDKNTNVSFLGCGIALWVADEFKDPMGLFYSSEAKLKALGVDIHLSHEVTNIDQSKKEVTVTNLKTQETFTEKYDKLVFAGGTWPIVPPFPGVEQEGIYLSKIFQHAELIKAKAVDKSVKNVVVIGAGYIGIELVEAFCKYGKKVTLVDMESRVVPRYFDTEFTKPMQDRMVKDGVNLQLGQKVQEFKGKNNKVTHVVTNKGEFAADMVIMSIGFIPQTQLLDVEKTQRGQLVKGHVNAPIIVDDKMRTSDKDVYAIGDSAALFHNVLDKNFHVALATNAVKSGLVAAMDIAGATVSFPGMQGTNAINVFGCHYTSTGFTEASCKTLGVNAVSEYLKDKDRPEFMHNAEDVQIKITYDPKTLRLLGAQIGSHGSHSHTEAIYMLSLAIQKKMTLPEIALSDFYFLPHYNKPFNYILQVILNALNLKYKS